MLAEQVFFWFVTENGEEQLKKHPVWIHKMSGQKSYSPHHISSQAMNEMKRQWCYDIQPWVDICPPLSVPSKVHLWCTCTFIPSITWPFLSSNWSRAQLHLLLIGQDMHSADHLSWTKKRVDKREGSAVHSTLQGRFKQLVRMLGPVLQDKVLSLENLLLKRGKHL